MSQVCFNRFFFALESVSSVLRLFCLKVQQANYPGGAKTQNHHHKHGDENSGTKGDAHKRMDFSPEP